MIKTLRFLFLVSIMNVPLQANEKFYDKAFHDRLSGMLETTKEEHKVCCALLSSDMPLTQGDTNKLKSALLHLRTHLNDLSNIQQYIIDRIKENSNTENANRDEKNLILICNLAEKQKTLLSVKCISEHHGFQLNNVYALMLSHNNECILYLEKIFPELYCYEKKTRKSKL